MHYKMVLIGIQAGNRELLWGVLKLAWVFVPEMPESLKALLH